MNVHDSNIIYSINNRSNVLYSVTKQTFEMSDKDIYKMIQAEFHKTCDRLKIKQIEYSALKKALVPNQEKKRHELCLVIDSLLVNNSFYGYFVFKELLKSIDKNSTYSILTGDYIDRFKTANSQENLYEILYENLNVVNPSSYMSSNQYFLIYFNSVTDKQATTIVDSLKQNNWFHGYAYLDNDSEFKSYIAYVVGSICIKHKNIILCSHPVDYNDNENVNMKHYPYEESGFECISVNEDSFSIFLDYKIESTIKDDEDEGFAFNALFPKFDSIKKLSLNISKEKYEYLCSNKTGKGGILKSLKFDITNQEAFKEKLYNKICDKHIYNLELNEYGIYKFNVCIDFETVHGNIRKTTVALKYFNETGTIELITLT